MSNQDRPTTGWIDRQRRARVAVAIIIATLGLAAAGVTSAAEPAGEPIPLTSLTGLTALEATVTIDVDGAVSGKPTQGDLTAQLTSTAAGASRIDVTGSLLGDVVAQVGGSAVKLFRPKKVSVYAAA